MNSAEININNLSNEERLFQLECEVTALTQFVVGLVEHLNNEGIAIPKTLLEMEKK